MPRNDSWKLEGEKMQPGVVAANPIPRRRRPSPRRLQIGSNASPTRQLSDEGGRSLSGGRRHAVLSGLGGLARPLPDDTRAYTSPSPSSTWRAPPLSAHDLHPVSTRLDFGNRVEYRPVPHRSPPPPPPLPPPNRAQVTIRSAWTGGDAAESPQAEVGTGAQAGCFFEFWCPLPPLPSPLRKEFFRF